MDLQKWEDQINLGDGSAIHARWESGRALVRLRKGKQLPKGTLALLAVDFGVNRSELTARMKFATKFNTEQELANALGSWRTWFAIKQYALTDKPRENQKKKKPAISPLKRALELIENFEPATADDDDVFVLEVIEACVRRYMNMNVIITLKDRRSERLNAMTVMGGSPIEASAM